MLLHSHPRSITWPASSDHDSLDMHAETLSSGATAE
jgi:hypothetical protein